MELARKVVVILAVLSVLLIYFTYNHCDSLSILTIHFRHMRLLGLSSGGCSERFCMQYLTPDDKDAFGGCIALTGMKEEKGTCHFMNPTQRSPIALVSFPGSGNTWVRTLLEQATGICTGAVYCDPWLRASGFTGENIRSGAVLVTKTHYPSLIETNVELFSSRESSKDTSTLSTAEGSIATSKVTTTALYLTEEINNHSQPDATINSKDYPSTDSPQHITEGLKYFEGSTETLHVADVKEEPMASPPMMDNLTFHLTKDVEEDSADSIKEDSMYATEGFTEDPKTLSITEGDTKTRNATEGTEEDPETLYVVSSDTVPHWGAAIIIIRNPFHALTAEYNREMSGDIYSSSSHTDFLGENYFGANKHWNNFVFEYALRWRKMIDHYFKGDRVQDRLCVMYEDLKRDVLSEVKRMLEFLHIDYDETELRAQLQRGSNFDFQRRHGRVFEHFTYQQKVFVNSLIVETLKDSVLAELLPVSVMKEYISSYD